MLSSRWVANYSAFLPLIVYCSAQTVTSSTWLNATKNGTLDSMTTTASCYGCILEYDYQAYLWASQITTYIAATVVTIINHETNVTATTIIPNPSAFTIDESPFWTNESSYVMSFIEPPKTFYWPTKRADVGFGSVHLTCCGPCTYSGKESGSCYGGSYFSTAPLHSCSTSKLEFNALASGITFADTRYPDTEDQIMSMLSFLGLPSGCEVQERKVATALTRVSYLTVDSTSIVNGPSVPTSTSLIPASTSLTIPPATPSKLSPTTTAVSLSPVSGLKTEWQKLTTLARVSELIFSTTESPAVLPNTGHQPSSDQALSSSTSIAAPQSLTVLPNDDHQSSIANGPSITASPTAACVIAGSSPGITGQAGPASLTLTPAPTLSPLTVGNQIITANPSSQYDMVGQTLVPDGPPITVSGTLVSLATAAAALIIGSSTIILTSASTTGLPIIAIAGTMYTADTAGKYNIGNQIVTPGGPAITVSSTPISLPLSGSVLMVGPSALPLNLATALVADHLVVTISGTTYTAGTDGIYDVDGQTLSPGGPAITVSGTPIFIPLLAPALVIGTSTEFVSAYPITGQPQITIAGTAYTANAAGDYLIGSQTLHADAPAITVFGTPISLTPSASVLVIGTKTESLTSVFSPKAATPLITIAGTTYTANAAGAYVIGTQTLTPGGPAITVSGTPISLGPAASVIVVDTNTETLRSMSPLTAALPLITIAGTTYTANAAGDYIVNSQTLIPGGPPITISGTLISLAPSASDVVIGTSTEPLTPYPPLTAPLPLITIAGSTYTANAAGDYIINSQTLIPGAPAITISGTPISLAPSASDLVLGTSTELLYPNPSAAILPLITIAGKIYTADAAGDYIIGSQTLVPGASGIVVSGTPVSLASDGKDAFVGTSVETLVALTTGDTGIGGAILSAFNGGAGGTGAGAGTGFTGGSGALHSAYCLHWGFVAAAVLCIAGG